MKTALKVGADLDDPRRLLSANQLGELLELHPVTIFKWSKQGKLPKPIHFGLGVTRWRSAEIVAFLDQKQAQTDAPAATKRGRPKKQAAGA